MATFYLDFENGNDANDGTTFANRWKTVTSGATAARIAPGDTIRIMASESPTSTGVNATWTNNSNQVTLASALNVLISDCNSAWTGSANVTANTDASLWVTGSASSNFIVAAGFTTGKIAYLGLGGTFDYSAYQGVTFAFYTNTVLADGVLQLKLCSDTTGDVAVDTININGLNNLGVWHRLYFDTGGALGASIQSIALYATADPGTVTLKIDNISTVKAAGADALNLTTLIGKQDGADGGFYPIRSISGTTITLAALGQDELAPTIGATGFYGTSESVTAYILKPIRVETAFVSDFALCQEAGTAGSLITYSGGWNRTDMSTQTFETYVSNGCNSGRCIQLLNFNRVDRLNPVWFNVGIYAPSRTDIEIGIVRPVACGAAVHVNGSERVLLEACYGNGNAVMVSTALTRNVRMVLLSAYNNGYNTGFNASVVVFLGDGSSTNVNNRIESFIVRGCNAYAYGYAQGCKLLDFELWDADIQYCKGSAIYGAFVDLGMWNYRFGTIRVSNCTENFYIGGGVGRIERLEVSSPLTGASIDIGTIAANFAHGEHLIRSSSISGSVVLASAANLYGDGWVHFHNYNDVANDHRGYYDGGYGAAMFSETGANRHTASGIGWRIDVKASEYSSEFPVRYRLASVVLESGVASQIKLFVKRSSLNINVRLKVYGDEVAGVATTVATATAAVGVWEELILTVTPTEYDQLDVWLDCWGGTTHSVYFDDFTVI